MDNANFDAPLPNPGQIIKFLCRSFSHVDDQNDQNIKKTLDRFALGSPKDPKKAFKILFRQIKPTYRAIGRHNSKVLKCSFSRAWQSYIVLVRYLKCGPLPRQEVVRIIDEHLFNLLFQDLLDLALKPVGLSSLDILGTPQSATRTVWSAYQGDKSHYKFSEELASKVHVPETDAWISSIESWRKRSERIAGGGSLNVASILRHSEIDQDVKFALLVANAYKRYCDLLYIRDCANDHSAADSDTLSFETCYSKLQEALIRENGDFVKSLSFKPGYQRVFASAELLTSAKRLKQEGDRTEAERILSELKDMTERLPLEFADMPLRGHFYIQSRDLKKALWAFEEYCEYSKLRDGPMLKVGLTCLLPLAVLLGRDGLVSEWGKWATFFGLEVNLQKNRAAVMLRKMFPNRYIEVDENLDVSLSAFGFYDRERWLNEEPDVKKPDRKRKGYANSAWHQIAIFAHLGQVEKVRALISNGASVDVVDENGFTPLMRAIVGKSEHCVDSILSETSDEYLNKVGLKNPYHALGAAIDSGNVGIVKKLLDAGCEVDLRGGMDRTSLYSIICELQALPSGSIRYSTEDLEGYNRGRHPGYIHTVSPFRRDQVEADIRVLLENEPTIKIIREFQRTQLSEVAGEMISLLLDYGANTQAVHDDRYTPVLAAEELGLFQIRNLLISHSKQ